MLAIVLGGCGLFAETDIETGDRRGMLQSEVVTKKETWETYDDLLAKVAKQVPAFGGVFLDEEDNSILYISLVDTKPQVAAAAERAIVTILGPLFPDLIPPREVRVLPAKYSFLQLKEWKDLGGRLLGTLGMVMIDADEVHNRVTIGLERMEMASQVEEELVKLGVPREAVIFKETGRVRLNQTLRDRMPPTGSLQPVGGLQIVYSDNSGTWACTLGFNATHTNSMVAGFVTAAHCSATRGAVDPSTVYYQPTIATNNRLGTERIDPPFGFRFWPPTCWFNACRDSDSNFAGIIAGVSFDRGYIARTTFVGTSGPGSITIDPRNRRFRITSKARAMANQTVDKVGRSSGWTRGRVIETCGDMFVAQGVILCDMIGTYYYELGDSGSPVFRITNSPRSGDVQLVGIHWGGLDIGGVFSSIDDIEKDLGTLQVCALGSC